MYPSWAPNPALLIYSIRGVRMGSHQYEMSDCDSNQFSSWYNLQLVITKCVSFHEKCSGQHWPFALLRGRASYTWNLSWWSPTTSRTLPSGTSNRFYLDQWGNIYLSIRERTIPRCSLTHIAWDSFALAAAACLHRMLLYVIVEKWSILQAEEMVHSA